jgi:Ca2+-dependent lipid-binding protein
MSLNEEEQRILQEIEKTFYESDPEFADRVRSETVYRHAGRNIKWAIVGFLAGLAFTLLTFTMSTILGAVGFLMMLASAVYFEQNLRKVGRASLRDIAQGKGGFPGFGRRSNQK